MLLALTAAGCAGVHKSEVLGASAARHAVRSAAVLPLENLTARQDAGRIAADSIAGELSAAKLTVTERGVAEAAMHKLNLTPGGTVDRLVAQRIGEILGVDAVVYGSVAESQDGTANPGPRHATMGLTVKMIETKTGATLVTASYTACADTETAAAGKAAGLFAKAVAHE